MNLLIADSYLLQPTKKWIILFQKRSFYSIAWFMFVKMYSFSLVIQNEINNRTMQLSDHFKKNYILLLKCF